MVLEDESHLDPDHRHRTNQPGTAEMFCARQVFRCFKFVEKLGERLLGAVGPYFVATALSLISVGTVCFCTSSSPPTSARRLFTELLECVYQSKSYCQRCPTPGLRRQYASSSCSIYTHTTTLSAPFHLVSLKIRHEEPAPDFSGPCKSRSVN